MTLQVDDLDAVAACASSRTTPSSQLGVGSSLKPQPRVLTRSRIARGIARLGGSPIRTDATKLTGRARAADARAGSETPFCRRARSSAALSNAHLPVEARALADRPDRERGWPGREQPRELRRACAPRTATLSSSAAPQELDLVDLVPRHVLALAGDVVRAAAEPHHGRDLREAARRVAHERLQLAALDDERQPGNVRVARTGLWRRGRIVARANASVEARKCISGQICQCSSLTAAPLYVRDLSCEAARSLCRTQTA